MRVEMAHLQAQGINFAVFAADANDRTNSARQRLLGQLVTAARRNNLRIDKAARPIWSDTCHRAASRCGRIRSMFRVEQGQLWADLACSRSRIPPVVVEGSRWL
jgi:hypothetical protein